MHNFEPDRNSFYTDRTDKTHKTVLPIALQTLKASFKPQIVEKLDI